MANVRSCPLQSGDIELRSPRSVRIVGANSPPLQAERAEDGRLAAHRVHQSITEPTRTRGRPLSGLRQTPQSARREDRHRPRVRGSTPSRGSSPNLPSGDPRCLPMPPRRPFNSSSRWADFASQLNRAAQCSRSCTVIPRRHLPRWRLDAGRCVGLVSLGQLAAFYSRITSCCRAAAIPKMIGQKT